MSKIDDPAHAFLPNGASLARFRQLEVENTRLRRQVDILQRALQRHAMTAKLDEDENKTWH